MHNWSSSAATRNSLMRLFDTATCTVMVMRSAICDMGVRSWLNRVRDTKAISGVRTLRTSSRMNVANVDSATCKSQAFDKISCTEEEDNQVARKEIASEFRFQFRPFQNTSKKIATTAVSSSAVENPGKSFKLFSFFCAKMCEDNLLFEPESRDENDKPGMEMPN